MENEQPLGKDKDQREKESVVFNTMSSDLMEAFRKTVLGNAALQAEVREARSAGDLVRIAARQGFGFSEEELKAMQTLAPRFNLGEVELEAVHFAAPCWCDPSVVNTRSAAA